MLLDRATVLGLAPTSLRNHRTARYQGDDQAVPLGAFHGLDQATIKDVYAFVRAVDAACDSPEALSALLRAHDLDALGARIGVLGRERPGVASIAHDLRAGVLVALLLELDAAVPLPLAHMRVLARDCAKRLRNLIADIDPPARALDLTRQLHSSSALAHTLRDGHLTLRVFADEEATIASCCTELGTIERIAFNLLDQATKEAPTREVEMAIVALEENLRVVVANLAGWRAGFTFSPTAADLVGRAYGIETTTELFENGHIGTKVQNGVFLSWFHWPLAVGESADCTCR